MLCVVAVVEFLFLFVFCIGLLFVAFSIGCCCFFVWGSWRMYCVVAVFVVKQFVFIVDSVLNVLQSCSALCLMLFLGVSFF